MDSKQQIINLESFSNISLNDVFFDSLRSDYPGFDQWYANKSTDPDAFAYTFRNDESGELDGFLYLKQEFGEVVDIIPKFPSAHRLKIGTFKINPHGTRLGERFMKRAFDVAIGLNIKFLYVTIFEKHTALVDLFKKYGFKEVGKKISLAGEEIVIQRCLDKIEDDVILDYPRIPISKRRHFVLSVYPEWHSRLLPDSLLRTEKSEILKDVSHTNSIHKIYLAGMKGVSELLRGDTLLIYRTQDKGPAYYTSVITSVCVVEDVIHISKFTNKSEFFKFCRPYSVFSDDELIRFYDQKKYPWIIKFVYNLSLTKKVNRKILLENVGLPSNTYWGFFKITTGQLKVILKYSEDYEKARTLVYSS